MGTTTDERDRVDRRAAFFFAVRFAPALVLRFRAVEGFFFAVRRVAFFLVFLRAVVFFLRDPAAFFFRDPVAFFLAVRLVTFFLVAFFLAAVARFLRAAGFFFLARDALARFFAVRLVAFFLVAFLAVPAAFLRVFRRAAVPTFFLVARFLAAVRTDDFARVVLAFLRRTFAKVTSPYELH